MYLKGFLCHLLVFQLTLYLLKSVFLSVFETQPKIGSFRLPTHRRGAHRNFSTIPSYFKIQVLAIATYLIWFGRRVRGKRHFVLNKRLFFPISFNQLHSILIKVTFLNEQI